MNPLCFVIVMLSYCNYLLWFAVVHQHALSMLKMFSSDMPVTHTHTDLFECLNMTQSINNASKPLYFPDRNDFVGVGVRISEKNKNKIFCISHSPHCKPQLSLLSLFSNTVWLTLTAGVSFVYHYVNRSQLFGGYRGGVATVNPLSVSFQHHFSATGTPHGHFNSHYFLFCYWKWSNHNHTSVIVSGLILGFMKTAWESQHDSAFSTNRVISFHCSWRPACSIWKHFNYILI